MRLAPLQVSGIEVRWHRHKPKKKSERYETVRAFGLSIYVASLSSVSRKEYAYEGYLTLLDLLSIVFKLRSDGLTARLG